MYFEDLFNLEVSNNQDWQIPGIISRIEERFYQYQDKMMKDIEVKDDYTERLYKCIDFDMMNHDWMIKDKFKKLIFNIYYILSSNDIDKDEFNTLKWFVVERLQGYTPSTHRCLYDLEHNN